MIFWRETELNFKARSMEKKNNVARTQQIKASNESKSPSRFFSGQSTKRGGRGKGLSTKKKGTF